MLDFKPAAFRPSAPSPAQGPTAALGRPYLGQTFDQLLGFTPAMGDVIRLGFHTASTYLGIYVGLKEKGFVSYLGWFLGVGQGIGAICDAISLGKRAMGIHPSEGGKPTPLCEAVSPTALPMAPRVGSTFMVQNVKKNSSLEQIR